MGTSRDHKGSSNRSPLVPAHADSEPGKPVPDAQLTQRFRGFRSAIRGFVSSGDSGKRDRALGRYARDAIGGASTGSRRFGAAASAAGGLIAGFSEIAAGGTGATSTGQDLTSALGQPIDSAAQIIAEALAPQNESHDRVRDALEVAICEALDGQTTLQTHLIDDEFLARLLLAYLSESIFQDVWLEAGDSTNATDDPNAPINAENALREFVEASVDDRLSAHIESGLSTLTADQVREIQLSTTREVLDDWENLPE